MARLSAKTFDILRRDALEGVVAEAHEKARNRGLDPLVTHRDAAYALRETEEGTILFRAPIQDGKVGEFKDVTDEYGVMDADADREKRRKLGAYVEAAVSRDRVEATRLLRELVQQG